MLKYSMYAVETKYYFVISIFKGHEFLKTLAHGMSVRKKFFATDSEVNKLELLSLTGNFGLVLFISKEELTKMEQFLVPIDLAHI